MKKISVQAVALSAVLCSGAVFTPVNAGSRLYYNYGVGVDIFGQAMRFAPQHYYRVPVPAVQYDPIVQKIQISLNRRGFDAGPEDGIAGHGTRNAVMNFQSSLGNAATGTLSHSEFVNLTSYEKPQNTPHIVKSITEEPTQQSLNTGDPILLKIQVELSSQGYDVGPQDGVSGSKTKSAIKKYQASLGNKPTGFLSEDEYNSLFDKTSTPKGLAVQTAGVEPKSDAYTDDEVRPSLAPMSTTASNSCSFPIADERFEDVQTHFFTMMKEDDVSAYLKGNAPKYSIDKCGVISQVVSGSRPKKGHVNDLFVDNNEGWLDTAYLGFLDLSGTSSNLNGVGYKFRSLFSKETDDSESSQAWMKKTLADIRKLYDLAGYTTVANAEFKKQYMEQMLTIYDRRPDFSETMEAFLASEPRKQN